MDVRKSVEEGYKFSKVADNSEENGNISTTIIKTVDPRNRKQYEWNAQAKIVIYVD